MIAVATEKEVVVWYNADTEDASVTNPVCDSSPERLRSPTPFEFQPYDRWFIRCKGALFLSLQQNGWYRNSLLTSAGIGSAALFRKLHRVRQLPLWSRLAQNTQNFALNTQEAATRANKKLITPMNNLEGEKDARGYDTSYLHVERPFYQDSERAAGGRLSYIKSDYAWNAESFSAGKQCPMPNTQLLLVLSVFLL